MEQRHHGAGDNVAGNKTTVNNVSIPKIIGFTLLGVSLFVVGYLLWPEPVYLSGYVYSSGGQPEEGVSLVVNTLDGREYQSVSNGEGFFRFDRLPLKRAAAGKLLARKDVREWAVALDTLDLTENGLRLNLPAGTPPFRISYYNLGAHAIDQVLQGKIKEVFGGELADRTYVLPNVVNDYYQRLLSEHGGELDEYFYFQRVDAEEENTGSKSWEETFLRGRPDDMRMLPGKGGTASTDGAADAQVSRADAVRLLQAPSWTQRAEMLPDSTLEDRVDTKDYLLGLAWLDKAGWDQLTPAMLRGREADMRTYLKESVAWEGEIATTPGYRKRMEAEYLTPLRRQIEFWNAIIGEELPPRLIRATLTQGGGCGVVTFDTYLTFPELYLQVAVLENISDVPIRLDTFVFRTLDHQALRPESAVRAALNAAAPQRERLFPQSQLAPGEKLLIPQYFYARTNEKAYLDRDMAREFGVTDTAFLARPDRERPAYVFGPVFGVSTVLLGPELYAFRGFDRQQLVLIDGIEAGSCPYAYTRADAGSPWRLEDHLIYGRRKRAWEGVDTLALHQFDGHLLVRERDPETSFLRHAYLLVRRRDGTTEQFDPDEPRLRATDTGYYRMERGDSLLLRFPGFRAREGDSYQLVNAGYYLPYQPDFSYRLQAAAERAREVE